MSEYLIRYASKNIEVASYVGNGEWDSYADEFVFDTTVTHWMPLPEPPKEVKKMKQEEKIVGSYVTGYKDKLEFGIVTESERVTTIRWHDAKKELPEKSGKYLVFMDWEEIYYFTYSAVYGEFNAEDSFRPSEIKKYAINKEGILYWADVQCIRDTLNPKREKDE